MQREEGKQCPPWRVSNEEVRELGKTWADCCRLRVHLYMKLSGRRSASTQPPQQMARHTPRQDAQAHAVDCLSTCPNAGPRLSRSTEKIITDYSESKRTHLPKACSSLLPAAPRKQPKTCLSSTAGSECAACTAETWERPAGQHRDSTTNQQRIAILTKKQKQSRRKLAQYLNLK